MQKLIQIIEVDGQKYKAVKENVSCSGCAFHAITAKCNAANAILSCTSPDELIFVPYEEETQEPDVSKIQQNIPIATDSIIAEIRELLLQRSETGIKKYSTTLDRQDLKPSEWCQHLLEELLDASGYVLRLKKDLEQIEKLSNPCKKV